MNIKRNIIFILERRKKIDVLVTDNVPILVRVIYGGNRIYFSTGYRIDTSKWDSDKQLVKNGCTNKLKQSSSEINTDLLKYYTIIQNTFKEFEVTDVIKHPNQHKEKIMHKVSYFILPEYLSENGISMLKNNQRWDIKDNPC